MAIGRLVRSGWWVAAAAVVVTLATLALLVRPHGVDRTAEAGSVAASGFVLGPSVVPAERVVATGMARDGLRPVDAPSWLTPDEVDRVNEEERGKLLVPDDRVVGVALAGGEPRAYPIRILRWHEVAHDVVGEVPVAVTYHPLSDAVVVLDRRTPSGVLSLGVSGLLYSSTQLLYERGVPVAEASLWSPLRAEAVTGPRAGERLRVLPAALTTWSDWRSRHPGTLVMAPEPDTRQLYKRDPYRADLASDVLRFPVEPMPPPTDLGLKDRVAAVEVGGEVVPLAASRVAGGTPPNPVWTAVEIGGRRVELRVGTTPAVAEALDADTGSTLPLRFACWFAWYATHPYQPHPRRVPPDRR